MIDKNYAKVVNEKQMNFSNQTWFIPHYAVINHKKSKLKKVFDCSAEYKGLSFNNYSIKPKVSEKFDCNAYSLLQI